MKELVFFSLLFCITNFICGQNLVPNGGFEEFSKCPGGFSEAAHEFRVISWRSANTGTPDYFHSCSEGEADVPHNWAGVSDAYEGQGYAGLFLWMTKPYREYLECELAQPLLRDSSYYLEFHYKLSSYSRFSIDRIGMLLSDSLIQISHDKGIRQIPTLSIVHDSALTQSTGLWEHALLKYRAKGGERYLVIGNFFSDEYTKYYRIQFKPVQEPMLEQSSYYYIDDVRVTPAYIQELVARADSIPGFSLKETDLNTNYVLKNIQFELNSFKLRSTSFEELDRVVQYLKRFPKRKVQLFGHTDDQGSDGYNLRLSRNRAQSVSGYLTTQGVTADRIESFGYGKTRPLINSTAAEARSLNRWVEIRFIE